MRIIGLKSGVILIISCVIVSCGVYSLIQNKFGPCDGTVIDAGTHVPIEGAVIVRVWESCGFQGCTVLAVDETVSDKNGKYVFPRKESDKSIGMAGGIREIPPAVFKAGYRHMPFVNPTGGTDKIDTVKKHNVIVLVKLPDSPYVRLEEALKADDHVRLYVRMMGIPLFDDAITNDIQSLQKRILIWEIPATPRGFAGFPLPKIGSDNTGPHYRETAEQYMERISKPIDLMAPATNDGGTVLPPVSVAEVFLTHPGITDLDFFNDKSLLVFTGGSGLYYKFGKDKSTFTELRRVFNAGTCGDKNCKTVIDNDNVIYFLGNELGKRNAGEIINPPRNLYAPMPPAFVAPVSISRAPDGKIIKEIQPYVDKNNPHYVPDVTPRPFKITPMVPYDGFRPESRTFTISREKKIFIVSGTNIEVFEENGNKVCGKELPQLFVDQPAFEPDFTFLAPASKDRVYGLYLAGKPVQTTFELDSQFKYHYRYDYILATIDGKCNVVDSKKMEFNLRPRGMSSTYGAKVAIADDGGFSVYGGKNYGLLYRHEFDAKKLGITKIRKMMIDRDGDNVYLIDEWPVGGMFSSHLNRILRYTLEAGAAMADNRH